MIESLDVMIWGKKVGTLVSTPKGYANQICFYYDADFVKGGLDIAPLSASIHGVAAQNGMPIYPESGKELLNDLTAGLLKKYMCRPSRRCLL